jgi:hypothetical protein
VRRRGARLPTGSAQASAGERPPALPGRLLGPSWTLNALSPGHYDLEGFAVDVRGIPHKGGRTFGYRVSDGEATLAYLSDHSPISLGPGPDGLGEYCEAAVALARGADLLVHDSQHTAAGFPPLAFLGHSAIEYVMALAQHAGARRVALFTTTRGAPTPRSTTWWPSRRPPLPVFVAYDGLIVDLP